MKIMWRKGVRILGLVFPVLYFFIDKDALLIFSFIVMTASLLFEFIRFKFKNINNFLFRYFDKILKKEEKKKISAISYFIIGAFFTILFFEKNIVILVLFYSVFGDLFSAVIGRYGKIRLLFGRTLEGSLAFLFSCLIVGFILINLMDISFRIVVTGAFIASFSELISYKIDDNLTIPLINGFILSFI